MLSRSMVGLLAVGLLVGLGALATSEAGGKKTAGVWTDPMDKTLPEDFKIQGEYGCADKIGRLPGDCPGQGHVPGGGLLRWPAGRWLEWQE